MGRRAAPAGISQRYREPARRARSAGEAGYPGAAASLLTSDDLFLFNQGTHYRLYDKLGAHVVSGGTHFAVWAPNATSVSVIGDWNGWRSGRDQLTPRESSGIWEGTVPGIGQGARYKFAIVGPDGVVRDKADPFAARAEHPPSTASVVWPLRHDWADAAWMASRGPRFARTE